MSDQLQSQIAAIEATEGDNIPKEQVKNLIQSVRGMFGDHFKETDLKDDLLFQELGELAKFINSAKKELKQVSSSQITDKEIPQASDQLDEIARDLFEIRHSVRHSVSFR